MAVEVTVRVSPRMYVEDVEVLRSWLARNCPAEWTERRDGAEEPGLSAADVILSAVLAGAGEAAAKAAIEGIREMLRNLADRYPATEPPPASVDAAATDPVDAAPAPDTRAVEAGGDLRP